MRWPWTRWREEHRRYDERYRQILREQQQDALDRLVRDATGGRARLKMPGEPRLPEGYDPPSAALAPPGGWPERGMSAPRPEQIPGRLAEPAQDAGWPPDWPQPSNPVQMHVTPPDTTFGCILTEDNDMEAQAARRCEEAVWLACAAHDRCPHGVTLSCVRDKHPQDEPHRDIDGIEWREMEEP